MKIPMEKVVIKYNDRVVGLSPVHDYISRSPELEDMCLYDWIARCEREKVPAKKKSTQCNACDSDSDREPGEYVER